MRTNYQGPNRKQPKRHGRLLRWTLLAAIAGGVLTGRMAKEWLDPLLWNRITELVITGAASERTAGECYISVFAVWMVIEGLLWICCICVFSAPLVYLILYLMGVGVGAGTAALWAYGGIKSAPYLLCAILPCSVFVCWIFLMQAEMAVRASGAMAQALCSGQRIAFSGEKLKNHIVKGIGITLGLSLCSAVYSVLKTYLF